MFLVTDDSVGLVEVQPLYMVEDVMWLSVLAAVCKGTMSVGTRLAR